MTQRDERCWGVLPAAGIGRRMGSGQAKQYLPLAGSTVLEHSLSVLLRCEALQGVVVCLRRDDPQGARLAALADPRVSLAVGGAERSDSVLAGLRALSGCADDEDWVLVHDAARPCCLARDVQRLLETVRRRGEGAILAAPVVDTVKQAGPDGRVIATLDRSDLWRAQTPQAFRLGPLRRALEAAIEAGRTITDEASAMEYAGAPVHLVPASSRNIKLTVPADLALAEWYLEQAGD